ncbi:MAG: transcription termination/antitermination protein NusA, partial [bacterium]|nr:transcription termination/antitermination protein NusA [bacterium]
MPAVQRSEFALALNQVATERGVDVSVVLETVKNAILAAYRKDHPGIEIEEYSASLDQNSGEAKIFYNKKDVTPPGFGRIAAQTAKQVILQKIREKEKEAIFSDYKMRVGSVVNGMVLRFAGPNVIVDIGKTEGIMPSNEQIPNERYNLNQRLSVYLLEIRTGVRGEEIIVSRSHSGLLEGLFKREVPEVSQGSVIIKTIAREPGNRSKIAVFSDQPGIDPVGSCVGQKGVRVQAVI